MVFEKAFGLKTPKTSVSTGPEATFIPLIESSVIHLQTLIDSNDTYVIDETTIVLCETINEFLVKCKEFNYTDDDQMMTIKCDILR